MKPLFVLFLILLCSVALAESQSRILIDQEVLVVRSDFKEFHFRVPEDVEGSWQMTGSYETSGGFKDDITLLAFDQQNYVRWFSHYKHQTLVKDERKMRGTFNFDVMPGETYYFVLYNFFSTVSNKKVKLHIELQPKQ